MCVSPLLTSTISLTSQCFSRPSSFSWAAPTTLSDLKRPLREKIKPNVQKDSIDVISSHEDLVYLFNLPLVDDFKLDTFGLDNAFEGTVVAVDVELELLLELRVTGAFHRVSFVPLSLLLCRQAPVSSHQDAFPYTQPGRWQNLCQKIQNWSFVSHTHNGKATLNESQISWKANVWQETEMALKLHCIAPEIMELMWE